LPNFIRDQDDWRNANQNFAQSRTRANGQLLQQDYTQTGHVSNVFSIGPAILWFPFLLSPDLFVLTCDLLDQRDIEQLKNAHP